MLYFLFPRKPAEVEKVTNLLLFWVAKDNLPLSEVDGEGFKVFMKEVFPKYKTPGRKKLTKLLDEKYNILSKKIKNRSKM